MNFVEGGNLLPGDWVDEKKLLLFMKTQVMARAPKKGKRLLQANKRKAGAEEVTSASKRMKKSSGASLQQSGQPDHEGVILEGEDDDTQPQIVLLYNSIRGYVSAIHDLWAHQVNMGLHNAPEPHRVAIKALETSVVRREHDRRREEYADRGMGTMKDGYLQRQIPDFTHQMWTLALGPATSEQSFRSLVDFLFGNTMLLRLSNRLPMELPDLFMIQLPKEGARGNGWCLVCVMDQGEQKPAILSTTLDVATDLILSPLLSRQDQSAWADGVWGRSASSGLSILSRRSPGRLLFLALAVQRRAVSLLSHTARLVRHQGSEAGLRPHQGAAEQLHGLPVDLSSLCEERDPKLQDHPQPGVRMQRSRAQWRRRGSGELPITTPILGSLLRALQIRRGGRWNQDQMLGCYLTTLPRQFMRGMADFEPDFPSSHFLPRETVLPPPSLLKKVWPTLDHWKDAYHKLPGTTEVVEENLASGAFLELLAKLRVVFLQVRANLASIQSTREPC